MLAPSHDLSICSVTRDHFLVSSFLLEPGPCQNLYPLVFVPSFVCSTIPVHKVLILLHTYVVVLVLLVNDRIIFFAIQVPRDQVIDTVELFRLPRQRMGPTPVPGVWTMGAPLR